MASNLPPGVTDSMLPGNRPEDIEFESFCDELTAMLDDAKIECNGDQLDKLASALFDYIYAR